MKRCFRILFRIPSGIAKKDLIFGPGLCLHDEIMNDLVRISPNPIKDLDLRLGLFMFQMQPRRVHAAPLGARALRANQLLRRRRRRRQRQRARWRQPAAVARRRVGQQRGDDGGGGGGGRSNSNW